VEERLTRVERGWEGFASDGSYEEISKLKGLLTGADLAYGITNVDVEEFVVDAEFAKKLEGEGVEDLMKIRQDLIAEQAGLRQAVRDEQEAVEEDERRARERRFDYGPLIYTWLKMLANKEGGVMKDLIEEVR
jgi:ubiquitin carboxyl-terminal hydrolase L5